MKKIIIICVILWLIIFILPLFAVGSNHNQDSEDQPGPDPGDAPAADAFITADQGADDSADVPEPAPSLDDRLISVKTEQGVVIMPMSEYIAGVLVAEMPLTFDIEALKAQAVAIRTYAMYKRALYDKSPVLAAGHDGADMCSDYTHCTAYRPVAAEVAAWGDKSEEYAGKVAGAVSQTAGIIMTYQGAPIAAVFHAVSDGMTEDAAAVWGEAIPYLVSVDSPGEEGAPKFTHRTQMDPENFKSAFLSEYPQATFSFDTAGWFQSIERSASGRILSLLIGGVAVRGTVFRQIAGLPSTDIEITFGDGVIIFDTCGYGHGVGMSQYGAQAMAGSGYGFADILLWYYPGVSFALMAAQV